eukprot:TRINITY_DN1136_c0_g2_i2.p1 TRINITY_DN1136_c0_g2~~TRINITY_DN1136_c0_g2_i2.p1  ORF type:complete len:628 (+),score=121.92 TRINITY_DN1136_c0_g2_i2:553-2436(+)
MDSVTFLPVSIAISIKQKDVQTAEKLAEATLAILDCWGLKYSKEERFLCHIVSDTTNVNPAFVNKMGYQWVPCACHLLQLVILDSLKPVFSVLKRHRNVVRYFKKSPKERSSLIQAQLDNKQKRPKVPIAGSVTRWLGTIDMLRRNLDLQKELVELLGLRVDDKNPTSEVERLKWNRTLSEKEWELSKQMAALLEFCRAPMLAFQSDTSPTLSLVGPFVIGVIKNCRVIRDAEATFPAVKRVASLIIKGLKDRFSPVLNQFMYSVATFVDPNSKSWFPHLPAHVQTEVRSFISSKLPTTPIAISKTQLPKHLSSLDKLLPCISAEPICEFDFAAYICAPVTSSLEFLSKQPLVLQELFLSVCGIPAASSEIERLFSTCGNVNSKLRCSLKPENVERESMLKKNSQKIKDFREAQDNYPTSSQKLRNWISSLPSLSSPFFHNDVEDKIEEEEEGQDDFAELLESDESCDEEAEEITESLQGDGYWTNSSRPKNFTKSVAKIKPGEKRKRHNEPEENADEPTVHAKKRHCSERFERVKKCPTIGLVVCIHFTDDCTCRSIGQDQSPIDPLECVCDLWFRGKVVSECEKSKEGHKVFAVSFLDGEEEEIGWESRGKNHHWALPVINKRRF